jgi:hypothetical protein
MWWNIGCARSHTYSCLTHIHADTCSSNSHTRAVADVYAKL